MLYKFHINIRLEDYTLRDIENRAPRRKLRIEMKFNILINKDERFT